MTDLLSRIERGEPVEAQEIFDYSVGKVIEQGARALSEYYQCAYKAENGNKCAFGHLIPDSLYRVTFENTAAHAILHEGGDDCSPELIASLGWHKVLIIDLQYAHDEAEANMSFSADFRRRAEAVAKEHGLTFKF